jgi:histidyl-tRNA synthetase
MLLAGGDQAVGPALDVFVVVADSERRGSALDLVSGLRRSGVRTDLDLGERSVKAQFRMADRREARYVVVVGDEWDQNLVTVRDLASGEQRVIAIEGIEPWVMNR